LPNTEEYSYSIINQIDACVEPYGSCSSSTMEKATKWAWAPSPLMVLMEAELEKARGRISELEEERRAMAKRLDRFLRDLAEEKASWKARVRDKARRAVAALEEERAHRRQLEQANAKLMRELAEARSSAKQQAQSYEMERKARELMEEACSELTREVEEDQAEVELLRRECLRMREEMEEERRMLQMAEVWREERVQMKLSDAKLALEAKYAQLSHLQAEMEEAFLLRPTTRFISDAAAAASADAADFRPRPRGRASSQHDDDEDDEVDADSVFDHFRRKERESQNRADDSPASAMMQSSESPATDLFLAKVDAANGGSSSADMDYDGGRDSCSWLGTSDRSASVAGNGNSGGLASGASRRSSVGKNTALIRRLWRSAIADSRKKTAGSSPSSDSVTPPPAMAVQQSKSKQSLREKLMEARMDDHKPVQAARHKTNI